MDADVVVVGAGPAGLVATAELVARMNALTGDDLVDAGAVQRQVAARDAQLTNPFTKDAQLTNPFTKDAQLTNPFTKDAQLTAVTGSRRYRGDRLIRTAAPHRFEDSAHGRARGRRVRRRGDARLPLTGGHLPRRHPGRPGRAAGRTVAADLA